jgi:hypothetical protein
MALTWRHAPGFVVIGFLLGMAFTVTMLTCRGKSEQPAAGLGRAWHLLMTSPAFAP